MAKKKQVPPKQRSLLAIKGDESFLSWLKGLADHVSLPTTNTVDLALKHYAEHVGYEVPMPRRQKR